MKWHFVLDENILMFALKREDDHGEPDDTCLQVIQAIIRQCHAFVITSQIWGKYTGQVRSLERQRAFMEPGIMRTINLALRNDAKDTRWLQDDQIHDVVGMNDLVLANIPHVDDGDQVFVNAAASVEGAILVTADRPLRAALLSHSIPERYRFRVHSPTETLDRLNAFEG